MSPSLIGVGIKRCFCLTSVCLSVCLSRTSGLSREQRNPGRPKLAYLTSHVTRIPLSRSEVKDQGHQAALHGAALTRKEAAAVSVRTYSAWESTATMRLLGVARGAHGEERGGAYCVATRIACLRYSLLPVMLE